MSDTFSLVVCFIGMTNCKQVDLRREAPSSNFSSSVGSDAAVLLVLEGANDGWEVPAPLAPAELAPVAGACLLDGP